MGSLGTGPLQSFRLRCHSWPPSALSSASIYENLTNSLKNQLQVNNKPGMVAKAANLRDEGKSTVIGDEKKPQLLVPKPRKAVAVISHSNLLFHSTVDHQDQPHDHVDVSENEEVKAVEEIQSIMMGAATANAVVAGCERHEKKSLPSHYPLRENVGAEGPLPQNDSYQISCHVSNSPTDCPGIFRISPDFEM
mmetsp:Transcript_40892/g.65736  ORF Transcript_40892/g.65736 Transcript_40892/m.65736 type:complete len:193 (+) Transcript_40892:84-662(+)